MHNETRGGPLGFAVGGVSLLGKTTTPEGAKVHVTSFLSEVDLVRFPQTLPSVAAFLPGGPHFFLVFSTDQQVR